MIDFIYLCSDVHFEPAEPTTAAPPGCKLRGHGGSDYYTIQAFITALRVGYYDITMI